MGCGGCELYPESPRKVMEAVDRAIQRVDDSWPDGEAGKRMKKLIHEQVDSIRDHERFNPEHHQYNLTNTNIWHMRMEFVLDVGKKNGAQAAEAAEKAIQSQVTCYAATLHLNKGSSIINPGKGLNSGYAPTFETLTRYPDRVAEMARKKDLIGTKDPYMPWKDGLPRMVFVSDMGDALTQNSKEHLEWLNQEVLGSIRSEKGQQHIWQWLTKRPQNMAKLSRMVGGMPENVCAMTTLTCPDPQNLKRLENLKKVKAGSRGLSLEPMWERIPPELLDLEGIDWVIVGGESGSKNARPFDLAWARELRDYCREQGVAVFIKQLGCNPVEEGKVLKLQDSHGGNWEEWPEDLRVREFTKKFYEYRKIPKRLRPTRPSKMATKKKKENELKSLSPEDQERFKELDKTVKAGTKGVLDAAVALAEIREKKLYKDEYKSFGEYCETIHDFSRQYAYALMKAGKTFVEMSTQVDKFPGIELPKQEAYLRELGRVKDPEKRMEILAEVVEETGGEYTVEVLKEHVEPVVGEQRKAKSHKQSPKRKLQNLKEDFDQLYDLVFEEDFGENDAKVAKLLNGMKKKFDA